MAFDAVRSPAPWTQASAAEIAVAAGAADLFVFRRIAGRRFAHVGGAGRGAGWAGIVEVGAEEEPLIEALLVDGPVVRRSKAEPWRVLGPYYGRAVAVVQVSEDVFVVFGAEGESMSSVSDQDLLGLARFASEGLVEVEPAKRLADELESLHAVQDLLHAPAETFEQAAQSLVEHAAGSLSCELAVLWLSDQRRAVICDRRGAEPLRAVEVENALAAVAEREASPVCIQEAKAAELPSPFGSADGVLAYYLLEIKQPVSGVLLLLHTSAGTPRGFTLLCQSLGRKLIDAAEPLLAAALLRDRMRDELERTAAQARQDPLTGLSNRLAWIEALSSAAACTESPASIVQLDCRGLKLINDTHGHHAGDQLLCRVASALRSSVRDHDLVARLGGDEFGILLCGADEEMTQAAVERIEATLAAERDEEQADIALAIGVATSRDGQLDAAQRRADAAMLDAKRTSGHARQPKHQQLGFPGLRNLEGAKPGSTTSPSR